MDLVNYFDILYDNPHGVVFTGQDLNGRVLLDLKQAYSIKELRLEINGKAQVFWNDINRKSVDSVVGDEKEDYFNFQVNLRNKENKIIESNLSLSRGRNEFFFQFSIAEDVPTSFEGSVGHIRYVCRASIISDVDLVTKRAFTVINNVDLNASLTARNPAQLENESISKFLCCKAGSVKVTLNIPYSGYVPGQIIPFSAEIKNYSRVAIRSTKMILKQLIMYHTKECSKKEVNIVKELEKGTIEPWTTGVWDRVPLDILSVPPTDLITCKIIDISYELEFHVSNSDLKMALPIIIGTIPLKHDHSEIHNLNLNSDDINREHPSQESESSPLFGEYAFGGKSIQEEDDGEITFTRGIQRFAPFYPMYDQNFEIS